MKKTILILLLLPVFVFAQTSKDSVLSVKINAIEKQFNELEKDIDKGFDEFNDKLLFQQKISEQAIDQSERTFNKISFQLNFIMLLVALAGVLGISVGFYVKKMAKQVSKSKREADGVEQKVKSLKKKIENNIPAIYNEIKREETINLLDRLVKFPDDINYISPLLLTRELQKEDFTKLEEAYISLLKDSPDTDNVNKFQILFFQQFFVLSLKDDKISQNIIDIIRNGLHYCSKKNIKETTSEFAKLLSQEGFSNFEKELSVFFNDSSMYNDELYEIFFNELNERELRFKLFDAIKENSNQNFYDKDIKIRYGYMLLAHYGNDNLNEQEQRVFEELNALKNGDNAVP